MLRTEKAQHRLSAPRRRKKTRRGRLRERKGKSSSTVSTQVPPNPHARGGETAVICLQTPGRKKKLRTGETYQPISFCKKRRNSRSSAEKKGEVEKHTDTHQAPAAQKPPRREHSLKKEKGKIEVRWSASGGRIKGLDESLLKEEGGRLPARGSPVLGGKLSPSSRGAEDA